jgi:sugar lactone lactonase YvrE
MFSNKLGIQRTGVFFGLILLISIALIAAAPAGPFPAGAFPAVVPLPDGFQPEGVAVGRGSEFFAGSRASGAVYHGDLRSGEGSVLVPAQEGRLALGLKLDERTNLLYVAGGSTGMAFVYDAGSGANVAAIKLTDPPTFVNDVVVTRDAVYFTDSFRPFYYQVPLAPNGGLGASPMATEIELVGDYTFIPGGFNANGIDATPDGKTLITVNSTTGDLYRLQAGEGDAHLIDLGGDAVPNGDGILLEGKTLYVVQNVLNQIAVVALDPSLSSGEVTRTLTSPNFRVPTTVGRFGDALYAVNARFDTPPTPDTEYEVVQVKIK